MTDEARIKRLIELAQRAWPGAEAYEHDGMVDVGVVHSTGDYQLMARLWHPRALAALEAALLVLADEARIPLTPDQVTRDALESCRRDREAITKRIREEREAMEQLASEWEEDARLRSDLRAAEAQMECARELRERARKP